MTKNYIKKKLKDLTRIIPKGNFDFKNSQIKPLSPFYIFMNEFKILHKIYSIMEGIE